MSAAKQRRKPVTIWLIPVVSIGIFAVVNKKYENVAYSVGVLFGYMWRYFSGDPAPSQPADGEKND